MSVIGARNTIDWVTGAWLNIRAAGTASGIPILDAATSKGKKKRDILSPSAMRELASTLSNIQQSVVIEQGFLAGQRALARVQNELLVTRNKPADTPLTTRSAISGNIINITS